MEFLGMKKNQASNALSEFILKSLYEFKHVSHACVNTLYTLLTIHTLSIFLLMHAQLGK